MIFPKTCKDAKFVVDGSALQTFITRSTKNFCLMLALCLGLNSLYLWPLVLVVVLSAKKSSSDIFLQCVFCCFETFLVFSVFCGRYCQYSMRVFTDRLTDIHQGMGQLQESSFYSTKSRGCLGRMSVKWPASCRVGHRTLTRSVSLLQ